MKLKNNLLMILTVLAISVLMVSCGGKTEEQAPAEEATEAVTEAVEETTEAVEETVDATEEEVEEVAEKVEDAVEEVKEKAEAPKPQAGIFKGKVVSLDAMVKGGNGEVSAAEAKTSMGKGGPLLFESNGKTYMVVAGSGAYAGKRLLKFVGKSDVTIKGKAGSKNGINYIIMTSIE